MKCNKCGKEIGDGFKFCKYCGSPMGASCPKETAGTGTRKKSKIPLVIVLVVAILALAGGGGFFLLKRASGLYGEKEKKASTETDVKKSDAEGSAALGEEPGSEDRDASGKTANVKEVYRYAKVVGTEGGKVYMHENGGIYLVDESGRKRFLTDAHDINNMQVIGEKLYYLQTERKEEYCYDAEIGEGYYKTVWDRDIIEIDPDNGNIQKLALDFTPVKFFIKGEYLYISSDIYQGISVFDIYRYHPGTGECECVLYQQAYADFPSLCYMDVERDIFYAQEKNERQDVAGNKFITYYLKQFGTNGELPLYLYQCENDYNLASNRLEHIKTDHYYCHIELPTDRWYDYKYRSKIKIPSVLTESEWEAILQKLSKEQQNLLSGYAYKRYDINNPGKKDDIEALKAKYPIYENQVIYALRDSAKYNILKKVEQYLEEAGCTEEMWEYNNSLGVENGAPEKEYLVVRYYDFETMKPVAQAEITMYIRGISYILPYRDHLIVVGWDENTKNQLYMIDGSAIGNLKDGEEPKIIQLTEESLGSCSRFEMNVAGDTLYYDLGDCEGWTTIDLSKY